MARELAPVSDESEADIEKEYVYAYAPVSVRKIDEFMAWAGTQEGEPVYYKLHEHHICRVKADKAWFEAVQPKLAEVWRQITYHRTIVGMKELTDGLAIKHKARVARADKRMEKAAASKLAASLENIYMQSVF